ncbi:MAG: Ku protein [bacterium]
MKSIWKGAISFGLVNIPVRMYSATQSQALDLDMLRKDDHCKVYFKRVCRDDGKEIPYEDIVKGYKYKDGDYVILTDKDFESANVEKTHTLEIIHFVKESEISSVYYDKPYFLDSEKTGMKAYGLLKDAIKKSGKVGVARYVIRNREHIGVIKTYKDFLIVNQLRYPAEIRSTEGLAKPPAKEASAKEIDMAEALIKQLTYKFKPAEYKDTYIDELKKIIEDKAKGKKVKAKGKAPKATGTKDIMTLLKKSIAKKAA